MWSSTQHARAMKKMMLAIALMLFILPFGVEAAEESHSAPGQEGSGEGGEHGEEGHPPSDAVLYLFVAILLGVFSRLLLSWTKLPYTGILLIWGIILGVIFEETTRWKYLGDGIEIWTGMDPNLFLLVFLPMLLFSSAFSMDWHIFKKVSGQALLLAVPGVIIGMCLTALVVKGVFPYDWSWKQAFLFGSIYSATDPVAVVAILHEVGASKKLGHVIEGESLLNDGSAYVFFLIFLEAVRGSDRSIGSYIGYFFELSLGAVGIGIGFGIVLMITLTRVFQDSIAEVVLIIAGAYMTYYVAEDLAEVAAVLATVCMGITMMAFGKPAISPNTSHPLHVVLESLEFVANTAVFVYSGTIIATRFGKYQTDDGEDEELDAKDVGYAFLMYIFGLIIRCIIIGVLFPILKRTGYGMTWKEAVVAVWSGLRGAVGLALALIVDLDLPGTVFSGQVLLFVGTTAVLTILVQGTSMPYLLQWLGMTDPSPAKLSMTLMVSREMEEFAEKRLSHLHRDSLLGDPDWEKVKAYTRINAEKLLPKRLRQKKPQPTLLERWMACLACCCRRGADVGVAADQEGGKGAEEGGKTAASPRQVKAEAGTAVELAAAGAPNLQMMSMHAADMGGLVMPSIYSTPSVGSGGMRSLQHSRTSIRSSHDLDELVAQRPAGADAPPMGPARSLLDSGRLKPTVSKQPDVEDIVEEMESELAEESQRDETVLDESPFGEGAGGGRKERAAPVLSRAGTFTNLQKASLVRLPTLAQEAVSQEEMLQEARTRLLHGMRAQYKEARERGYIGEELLVLEESISEALDHVDQPICDFQVLARSLALPRWMKWLVGMLAHWGLEHLSNWLVYQSLSLGTSALASYFHAHRKVQRELLEVIEQLHSLWLASKDKQILQQVRVLATVMHESKEEQAQASSVLVKTRAAYPLVVRAIRTRDVSKYVLLSQMTFVEDLSAAGFLDETEVDQLCKLLHEKAKRLYFHPPSVAFPSMTKRLHSHVLFDQLDDRTFADEVWAAGRAAIFDEGDILPNAVDPAEVLVVLRGICRHKNGHNYASSGHVFGLSNMMLGRTCVPEDAGDLVAESGVLLFRMPRAKMQELHHHHPSILEATWCVVAAEAAPHLDERRFGSTVSTELIHFFRNAEVHYARDNSWLEVPIMTEAILLAGAVLVSAASAARTGPCILDSGVYKCSGNVTVVQIPTGTPHLPVLQVTIPSFN